MTALLTDNLPLLAGAPNGIKKLRELILELAVRGKLLPQDPSDEPASELLKRIAEEKARLVEKGEIKKQKPMAAITEEEKPYDLPDSWAWVRLPEIYYSVSVSGNKLLSSQISEEGIFPVVDQGKKFVSGYTDDESLLIRLPGPVVVFGDHTTERKYVDFDFVAGADGVKILRPVLLDEKFFWWHLVGLKLEGRGYARHFKVLNDAFFALPPRGEQSRIVAKVDELMALCDRLEAQQADAESAHAQLVQALLDSLTQASDAADFAQSWQRLTEHFHTLFSTESSIDALKQALLQLAVMGKLVPQDPNDEPASELLKRIAEEKTRLVAEGKINKQKPLPEIGDNEKSFELPAGWAWQRFADFALDVSTGPFGSLIHQSDYVVGGVPLVNPSHMIDGRIVPDHCVSLSPEMAGTLDSYRLSAGDMVMARRGEVGRVALVTDTEDGWLCGTGSFVLRFTQEVSRPYIWTLFRCNSIRTYLAGAAVGTTMVNLNHGILLKMPTAVPPLAEQHRIVAKVDQLMALCDQLKTRLTQARQLNEQLASTLVEQAVA